MLLTLNLNQYHHMTKLAKPELSEGDISRVIEMAWEDRTPFEAI